MTATISIPPHAVIRQTLDDLMREEGKAELIDGRIVTYMPSGLRHGTIKLNIATSLAAFAKSIGIGVGGGDGVGFAVDELLGTRRESFAPDAFYHTGALPANPDDFIEGPPDFAVEVRSKWDHGPIAEDNMADKRADYFEAGTKAVWDVDPVAETVRLYLISSPNNPVLFTRGQLAHAEPAVPGWTMAVESIFG